MEYTITIVRTTGKKISEFKYTDWQVAKAHFEKLAQTLPYSRVLILLLEKVEPDQENILEVDFVEGLPNR